MNKKVTRFIASFGKQKSLFLAKIIEFFINRFMYIHTII